MRRTAAVWLRGKTSEDSVADADRDDGVEAQEIYIVLQLALLRGDVGQERGVCRGVFGAFAAFALGLGADIAGEADGHGGLGDELDAQLGVEAEAVAPLRHEIAPSEGHPPSGIAAEFENPGADEGTAGEVLIAAQREAATAGHIERAGETFVVVDGRAAAEAE